MVTIAERYVPLGVKFGLIGKNYFVKCYNSICAFPYTKLQTFSFISKFKSMQELRLERVKFDPLRNI